MKGVSVIIGLQWGDEGKGKVIDSLVGHAHYDVVARFQGGPNAGHTIHRGGKPHVLHQIPSGIFHEHTVNVLGDGMLIDPYLLKQEVDALKKCGVLQTDTGDKRLVLGKGAHLLLRPHEVIDRFEEAERLVYHKEIIGTTRKGIGPCYQDKAARRGFRVSGANMKDEKISDMASLLFHYHWDRISTIAFRLDAKMREMDDKTDRDSLGRVSDVMKLSARHDLLDEIIGTLYLIDRPSSDELPPVGKSEYRREKEIEDRRPKYEDHRKHVLEAWLKSPTPDPDPFDTSSSILAGILKYLRRQFHVVDTGSFLREQLREGKKILAEGAQGTLLDLDHGTYPYVTSSNTIAGQACVGLGLAPREIGTVYGVSKIYCTRVGEGPFPSEAEGAEAEKMQSLGKEFGATTERPRRCGWLDLPALRYAIRLNGVSQLFLTKVDVLSGFKEIKLCQSYGRKGGQSVDEFSPHEDFSSLSPNFKSFKGWRIPEEPQYESKKDLPAELNEFLDFVETWLEGDEVRIAGVSYGPEREQMLFF